MPRFSGSGDPDARTNKGALAGIANEGPDGSYEAEQAANRAYPADSVPLSATLSAISTFSSLKKKAKGPGTWEVYRAGSAEVSRRARPVPRRR